MRSMLISSPRQLDVVGLLGLSVVYPDLQHREPALQIVRTIVRAILGLELGLDLTIDHDGIAAQRQVVAGLLLSSFVVNRLLLGRLEHCEPTSIHELRGVECADPSASNDSDLR